MVGFVFFAGGVVTLFVMLLVAPWGLVSFLAAGASCFLAGVAVIAFLSAPLWTVPAGVGVVVAFKVAEWAGARQERRDERLEARRAQRRRAL